MRSSTVAVSGLCLLLLAGCGEDTADPADEDRERGGSSSSATPSGSPGNEALPSDTTPPGTELRYGEPASVPGVADANHRYQVAVLGVRKGQSAQSETWTVRLQVSALSELTGESAMTGSLDVTDGRGQPIVAVPAASCPPILIDKLTPGGKPAVGCLAFERTPRSTVATVAYARAPYATEPITWVRPTAG